ncbi:cytochrome oxidase putative small subunit CydP [Dyella silvatica]|uniref:cytochrome oxidase putative small subunit CydP n=1 Tax=Dyella silvatica TaxID=2992128 RepID=UPI0031B868AE
MSTLFNHARKTALPRRPLRRLALELILIVVAKIALLSLIWWVAIAPHPRPDTRPEAIEHLLAPTSSSSPHEG